VSPLPPIEAAVGTGPQVVPDPPQEKAPADGGKWILLEYAMDMHVLEIKLKNI
jgi:hypothetical protein